jgi:hypothetical protein
MQLYIIEIEQTGKRAIIIGRIDGGVSKRKSLIKNTHFQNAIGVIPCIHYVLIREK